MAQDFPFSHFLKVCSQNITIEPLEAQLKKENTTNSTASSENDLINQEVLTFLKDIVPEIKFKTYFENNLILKNLEGNDAHFEVKTLFIKKNIEAYKDQIALALLNVLGNKFNISIEINNEIPEVETNKFNSPLAKPKSVNDIKFTLDLTPTKDDLISRAQSQYIDHVTQNQSGIIIDRSKTFENFIVGPSNNIAHAASEAVAQMPGSKGKYPSLYIHSNSGLGKTHLLHAVANSINDKHPSLNICLLTAKDFMDEMITLMKANRINEFVKKYTEKIDVLMIDDIHELKNKEGTQDQFFHVFNEMHNKGKQLIFTSDKRPKEIDGISERIKTRLQWGLVVDIQPPDLETRIAILRRKMESLDLYITEDILTLIASKIKTNIRELEGSLVRLKAVSELMNVEIEIDLVKEQLMFNSNEDEKEISLEQIAKATAQYYRLPLADLKSKGRSQDITKARHVAMYLARKIINAKQQEIGQFFGGRDHSSVIHAVNTITEKVKIDAALSKDINAIESNL